MNFPKIKKAFEDEKCSVHNEHPKVQIKTNGIQIDYCCCDEFRKELIKNKDVIMLKGVGDEINNIVKNTFKK